MKRQYKVMMQVDDQVVSSSALFAGTQAQCHKIAARNNNSRDRHESISYVVLPCVESHKEATC
jgi:hypothetical protein